VAPSRVTPSEPAVARYAIYVAPPAETALWRIACDWLGRDPEQPGEIAPQGISGVAPDRHAAMVAEARRYGFHGTLKPPFALADGIAADDLAVALEDFAAGRPGLPPIAMQVASIGGFLAVIPAQPAPALHDLADAAVEIFDRFRAPPSAAELARRRQKGLSPVQDANLARWGYPYVFEEFRFHMTLTERLAQPEREFVLSGLRRRFSAALEAPVHLEGLALFGEPAAGEPFRLLRRFRFAS